MVIRTKFYIGDIVWFLCANSLEQGSTQAISAEITAIEINNDVKGPVVHYKFKDYYTRRENDVFRNLNALYRYLRRQTEKVTD